jgi:hypothetical protein
MGKRCVTINVDESPIPATFTKNVGNVVPAVGKHVFDEPCSRKVSSSVKRQNCTLLMAICDDDAINKKLPQLIIVGDKLLTLAETELARSHLPKTAFLKRRRSGWNTSDVFIEYLTVLKSVLTPFTDTVQFIFTCDAVPLHVERKVLDALDEPHMFYFLLIPSKLTWMLQPLDVGVFGILKRLLRKAWNVDVLQDSDEKPMVRMLRILCDILHHMILTRTFKKVFRLTGFAASQSMVSSYIKKILKLKDLPVIPADKPDDDLLRLCWPSNRKVTFADIAQTQPRPAPALLAIPAEDLVHDAALVAAPVPHLAAPEDDTDMAPPDPVYYSDEDYFPESPAPPTPVAMEDSDAEVPHIDTAMTLSYDPTASSSTVLRRRCSFKQPG